MIPPGRIRLRTLDDNATFYLFDSRNHVALQLVIFFGHSLSGQNTASALKAFC